MGNFCGTAAPASATHDMRGNMMRERKKGGVDILEVYEKVSED